MYGPSGFIEIHACFPWSKALSGIEEMLQFCQVNKVESFISGVKVHSEGNSLASFEQDGISIGFDIRRKRLEQSKMLEKITWQMHQIIHKNGGKIYLAKDSTVSAYHFKSMFPTFWLKIQEGSKVNKLLMSDLFLRLINEGS